MYGEMNQLSITQTEEVMTRDTKKSGFLSAQH